MTTYIYMYIYPDLVSFIQDRPKLTKQIQDCYAQRVHKRIKKNKRERELTKNYTTERA